MKAFVRPPLPGGSIQFHSLQSLSRSVSRHISRTLTKIIVCMRAIWQRRYVMRFLNSVLSLLPLRFVSSLLEEPEVAVIGAGRGPAGSIIHKLFVSAQRVNTPLAYAHTHAYCLYRPFSESWTRIVSHEPLRPPGRRKSLSRKFPPIDWQPVGGVANKHDRQTVKIIAPCSKPMPVFADSLWAHTGEPVCYVACVWKCCKYYIQHQLEQTELIFFFPFLSLSDFHSIGVIPISNGAIIVKLVARPYLIIRIFVSALQNHHFLLFFYILFYLL